MLIAAAVAFPFVDAAIRVGILRAFGSSHVPLALVVAWLATRGVPLIGLYLLWRRFSRTRANDPAAGAN